MKIMTVVTGCGILIACSYSFAMDQVAVHRFFVVALDAFCNGNSFILFPVGMGVDVSVTVGAFHVMLNMNAVVMFGIFFFVAAFAANFGHLDFT